MIRIRVTRRANGVEIHAVGHAGYAPRGEDVVCAGISALLYGFVAYLKALSSVATAEEPACQRGTLRWEATDGDGELWVRTCGDASRVLEGFAAVEAGIRLIARAYPQFVVLEEFISQEGDVYEST
jgi:uncharacterized protein YsxB (DUF464 family)